MVSVSLDFQCLQSAIEAKGWTLRFGHIPTPKCSLLDFGNNELAEKFTCFRIVKVYQEDLAGFHNVRNVQLGIGSVEDCTEGGYADENVNSVEEGFDGF